LHNVQNPLDPFSCSSPGRLGSCQLVTDLLATRQLSYLGMSR